MLCTHALHMRACGSVVRTINVHCMSAIAIAVGTAPVLVRVLEYSTNCKLVLLPEPIFDLVPVPEDS